jgi:fumarylacetoacetate (FAA) hydrolase
MKLATLKSKASRDGDLVVVSRDLKFAVRVNDIAANMREAVERWSLAEPKLKKISDELNDGLRVDAFPIVWSELHSALPRTWLFADGSAFIHHIKLVRKARNAELPATLETVPLMYQAESGSFLAFDAEIPQIDMAHGTDFEAEVGVIVDDVPMGISAEKALEKIRLVVLINDVSLRGLIPAELAQGFGFFQSKPSKALSPLALTVDELGSHWQNGRLNLPLNIQLNGQFFGNPEAGQMHFHFGQLIAHAARTRNLVAGSLIGSGTVSNEDETRGCGCLAEKRTIETIKTGAATTSFLRVGDQVEIWMTDKDGRDLFGRIKQKVVQHSPVA